MHRNGTPPNNDVRPVTHTFFLVEKQVCMLCGYLLMSFPVWQHQLSFVYYWFTYMRNFNTV